MCSQAESEQYWVRSCIPTHALSMKQQRAQQIDIALRRFWIDAQVTSKPGHLEQPAPVMRQHGPEAAQRLSCDARAEPGNVVCQQGKKFARKPP